MSERWVKQSRWRATRCGPPRHLLGRPWREVEYCVVDVETTGLDLHRDSIVSFGAVCVVDGRVRVGDCAYQVVRPDCDVSIPSVCIHGLRPVDLADAPSQAEALPVLADLLDGRVLVAHAAWVERAFLSRAFRRIGTRLVGPVVDTAELVRAASLDRDVLRGHEPSLERTAVSVGLEPHSPHHAMGDALTTGELMLVMAVRLGAVTVADLVYPDHRGVRAGHHLGRAVTA